MVCISFFYPVDRFFSRTKAPAIKQVRIWKTVHGKNPKSQVNFNIEIQITQTPDSMAISFLYFEILNLGLVWDLVLGIWDLLNARRRIMLICLKISVR